MATVDSFLKIEGIPGESTDDRHRDEIDVVSWFLGATQELGQGGGKVQIRDFSFVKKIDKAGPKLFEACVTRRHIAQAALVCRRSGREQHEFLKITLSDCLISSYEGSTSAGGDERPTEQVSINFAKIAYEYREERPDGTVGGTMKTEFNLKTLNVSG